MGDSETFGASLSEEQTIGGQLQVALNRQSNDTRFEVLNFGFPGYNTKQSVRLLHTIALEFNPQIVILYYVFNDPLTAGVSNIVPRRLYYKSHFVLLLRWYYHVYVPSAYYYRDSVHDRQFVQYYEQLHASDAYQVTADLIADTLRYLQARKIRFIVAIAPELMGYDNFSEYPYATTIHEQLRTLESSEVEVIDPLSALSTTGLKPTEFWVTPIDVHKNGAANALIATDIAESILSSED